MRKTHREWDRQSGASEAGRAEKRVSHVKYGSYFFSYKWDPAYTSDTSAEPTTALFFSVLSYYGFFKLLLLLLSSFLYRYANNPTRPINLLIIFKVVQNWEIFVFLRFSRNFRSLKRKLEKFLVSNSQSKEVVCADCRSSEWVSGKF